MLPGLGQDTRDISKHQCLTLARNLILVTLQDVTNMLI